MAINMVRPARMMDGSITGGFQLLLKDDRCAAKAFQQLPELLQHLEQYRQQRLSHCRLALDWIATGQTDGLNAQMRSGLYVRLNAPVGATGLALEQQSEALCSDLLAWLQERGVAAVLPETPEEGLVQALPSPERMRFLSKERRLDLQTDGQPLYYYAGLEAVHQLDVQAIGRMLCGMEGCGLALQLFATGDEGRLLGQMEQRMADLGPGFAQDALKAYSDSQSRYACNLIVWGQDRKSSDAAAEALCALLRAGGLYLRSLRIGVMGSQQYYQAIYDAWELHRHVAKFVGNGQYNDLSGMANALTGRELAMVCAAVQAYLGEEMAAIEATEQEPVEEADEEISEALQGLLDDIDELLGEDDQQPTPLQEEPDTLLSLMLERVMNAAINNDHLAQLVQLQEEILELRGQLTDQQRQMSAMRDDMADIRDDQQQLSRNVDHLQLHMEDMDASLLTSRELLEQYRQQADQQGFQMRFAPEQLSLMGVKDEQELEKQGLSGDMLESLRCVAAMVYLGLTKQQEQHVMLGRSLGCFYEELLKDTFIPALHMKEREALQVDPAERLELSAVDSLCERRIDPATGRKYWASRSPDYRRLKLYSDHAVLDGQKGAVSYWHIWFVLMKCMRRFRNGFVHSDEDKAAEVSLEALKAAHELFLSTGTEAKKQIIRYYQQFEARADYRIIHFDSQITSDEQIAAAIEKAMDQHPEWFEESLLSFLLRCKRAQWA